MKASPSTTRRVLVVAYNFPPVGGVGIQRTLKYVTYLPDSGWEPVVLTSRDPGVRPLDESALLALPSDLAVERAFSPEPSKLRRRLGDAVRTVRSLTRGHLTRPDESSRTSTAAVKPPADSERRPALDGPIWARLGALWRSYMDLAMFPDDQVGWVPFAIRQGLALNAAQPFDAIYSSAAPMSSHLVAAAIARQTGVPWIADFRDPWIGNAFAKHLPFWQRALQTRMERTMVRLARRVTVVTDGMRCEFEERYPWAVDRFVTIPNGYDRGEFDAGILAMVAARAGKRAGLAGAAAKPGHDSARPFRLVYTGTIWGEHELEFFLDGLELLLARRPDLRGRFEVDFIGWLNAHNQTVAESHSAPERLGSVVRYSSFVPRREALFRAAQADAGFHLIADGPGKEVFLSGKLPEYAGLDLPIILFAPEGSARAFLRELNWGVIADPTPEGVADGMERLLESPQPDRPADPEGRYERAKLAARLAKLLDDVATR